MRMAPRAAATSRSPATTPTERPTTGRHPVRAHASQSLIAASTSLGRLEVRAVAAGQLEPRHGPAHARLDAVELLERAVGVVHALDEERRAGHALGVGLEAPVAERRVQPDVAPAPERGVDVVVVAGHPLAQAALGVALASDPDLRDRDLLDEHVRREQRDAGHRVLPGVDERDRGAVAVADQDRLGRVELGEHLGQHLERLLVEERRRPGAGRGLRAPVPEARERDHAPTGRLVQPRGEVAPEADRAEPFVQQDERSPPVVARPLGRLQPAPRDEELSRADGSSRRCTR